MSAPAAKARSLPVMMMQRTSAVRSQASSASASSLSSGVERAFNASGRFKVTMPTAPVTSVFTLLMASSRLTFGTIESRAPRLHNAFYSSRTTQFAGLAFTAIDQEVVLEVAGIAGGLGVIAQGRIAGSDGVLEHFFDRGHQRCDTLLFDGAGQPLGRDTAAEKRLADIDIAQTRHHPLIQQRR